MVESSCKSSGRVGGGGNWGEGPGISIPRCSRVWRERATTCVGCGRANRLGCHGWSRGRSDSTGSGRRRRGILPTNLSEFLGVSTQVPLQGGVLDVPQVQAHSRKDTCALPGERHALGVLGGGWSPDPPPQLLGLASKSSRGGGGKARVICKTWAWGKAWGCRGGRGVTVLLTSISWETG